MYGLFEVLLTSAGVCEQLLEQLSDEGRRV